MVVVLLLNYMYMTHDRNKEKCYDFENLKNQLKERLNIFIIPNPNFLHFTQ